VTKKRPALFRERHFQDVIIVCCVRWYLWYSLSYQDLEEIMAERGLSVDHVTIWRWVQRDAPVLNQRIRRELRYPNRSWRVDETYVRVAGTGPTTNGPSIPLVKPSNSRYRPNGIWPRRSSFCGIVRREEPTKGHQCGWAPGVRRASTN
jgi:hypothetical protein